MRAILVSVDYSDLLAITLPCNRHHFSEVTVVTTPTDLKTHEIARQNDCRIYATDVFYRNGAVFGKWQALEEGLDFIGRKDWLTLMDADILWPKIIDLQGILQRGWLYTPLRRMWNEWPNSAPVDRPLMAFQYVGDPLTGTYIPEECEWSKFPIHRNTAEWAGYSQIFHCEDPALGKAPWHQVDWKHAGGADSMFQEKWPAHKKVRPPFECLHLGPAGQNWYGRATPYADGSIPQESDTRLKLIDKIWRGRRGKHGDARFEGEKIK